MGKKLIFYALCPTRLDNSSYLWIYITGNIKSLSLETNGCNNLQKDRPQTYYNKNLHQGNKNTYKKQNKTVHLKQERAEREKEHTRSCVGLSEERKAPRRSKPINLYSLKICDRLPHYPNWGNQRNLDFNVLFVMKVVLKVI